MVHFGSADKGAKTQIEAPKEKQHSSLRDSSGIVFSVKDAINQAVSAAAAEGIYMLALEHQSSTVWRNVARKWLFSL